MASWSGPRVVDMWQSSELILLHFSISVLEIAATAAVVLLGGSPSNPAVITELNRWSADEDKDLLTHSTKLEQFSRGEHRVKCN